MYDIEAKIPYQKAHPSTDLGSEWEDGYNFPQLETDVAEYNQARTLAKVFREFYKEVRVVRIHLGGRREVVRECPFDHAHTREWCGYSECRES